MARGDVMNDEFARLFSSIFYTGAYLNSPLGVLTTGGLINYYSRKDYD